MWSSSGDMVRYLLDQKVAERSAQELLELLVEGADRPHIVSSGRRHVRADVGTHVLEVPSMLEDRVLRVRVVSDPRLQQVKGKLRVDHLFGGELREDGSQHRFLHQLGHIDEKLGGKVLGAHEVHKFRSW